MKIFHKTGHEDSYVNWWLLQQENHQDIVINLRGLDIHVKKSVFLPDPSETYSTSIMLDAIPKDLTNKSVLDIGGGCGVLGIYAANNNAKKTIIADPDQDALANIQYNVKQHHFSSNIEVRKSDLFSDIDENFDIVIANLPIVDVAWPEIKEGTQNVYARFVQNLPQHLTPEGICYLSFASFGDTENFENLIKNQPLPYDVTTKNAFDVNWYAITLKNVSDQQNLPHYEM